MLSYGGIMNRSEIINDYSKGEFSRFLETDYSGKLLELLNEEGLCILEKSPLKEDRINYILAFSKYKDELFQNEAFLNLFFKTDLSYYYANLNSLKDETYEVMINKYLSLNPSSKEQVVFLSYFNKEYILKKLDNWPYGTDDLYELINLGKVAIVSKIIANYNIDLSDSRINIEKFVELAKYSALKAVEQRNMNDKKVSEINIPINMVNKKLAERLLDNYDIFKVRKIVNDLEYVTNTDEVNNYIKTKENNFINSYNDNTCISPYKEIFESFKKLKEALLNDDDNYFEYRYQYVRLINHYDDDDINMILEEKYKEGNINGVYEYLKELSDRELSNYIIDYNFEENYHNIMIDVRELLRFYYDGNVVLPKERAELYEQISNIDYLSIEEKKELHNTLKKINMKEIFYDDMSYARYIVNEAIKNYSLTIESIKKYRDSKLSQQYGVDVYVMHDEPFFGIVKSSRHVPDELPTGHSYSLVGNDCVATYGSPEKSNTFLYDAEELNPEQIVHVYPFDSFTMFKPFNSEDKATNRVHPLMMPEEITGLSAGSYSEILILEQGTKPTDIDKKIPELKRIALYCVDEISEQDIETAKNQGLGIILVSSKKYFENKKFYEEKYKIFEQQRDYNYFNGSYEKNKFEAKR